MDLNFILIFLILLHFNDSIGNQTVLIEKEYPYQFKNVYDTNSEAGKAYISTVDYRYYIFYIAVIDYKQSPPLVSYITLSPQNYISLLICSGDNLIGFNGTAFLNISSSGSTTPIAKLPSYHYSTSQGIIHQNTLYVVAWGLDYNYNLIKLNLETGSLSFIHCKYYTEIIGFDPNTSNLLTVSIFYNENGQMRFLSLLNHTSGKATPISESLNDKQCSGHTIDHKTNTYYTVCDVLSKPILVKLNLTSGAISTLPFKKRVYSDVFPILSFWVKKGKFSCLLFFLSLNNESNNFASRDCDIETEFNEFIAKYKKSYSQEEREIRKQIFATNLQEIERMREDLIELGHTGSFPSITKFSDMTTDEFKQKVLMPPSSSFNQPCDVGSDIPPNPVEEWPMIDIPSSFDWTEKGAVTPAKDQGSVGTCWAFSTTGNIEGQWFLHTNGTQLISLSEEQLNDCDSYDCGVFGGWPCRAYQYVIQVGGLMTEQSYPYCVGTGACYPCSPPGYNETFCGPSPSYCNNTQWPCKAHKGQTFPVSISGWKSFGTNETELQAQLIANGPLSVLMDASGFPPLEYHEYGVYDPWSCDPTSLDHAVLLVGYGDDDGTPYWIVKNSWGADWCDNGFFKIRRGSGTCGINLAVTSSYV